MKSGFHVVFVEAGDSRSSHINVPFTHTRAEVTIFVDREAVRMGEQGQPLLRYGDSDLEMLLSNFLEGGGSVLVCPHCAELGGVEPGELRSGFALGTPESIAALFLNADTVISY
jgi:sulfur relay (sulfurtransferase) complex TusBCD TusD component (DsrE family)